MLVEHFQTSMNKPNNLNVNYLKTPKKQHRRKIPADRVFETRGVDVVCYSVLLSFVLSFIQVFFAISCLCVDKAIQLNCIRLV